MGMVFRAAGLKAPEKHLLTVYCNLTDPHGYCWPGEERLAADSGMSVRTVQRTKAALVARNLIKSVRRVDRQTGDPISNLTRVNLPLLASMARKRTRFDDDLLAGLITFDDDAQGDPETTLPAIDAAAETGHGAEEATQRALEAPETAADTLADLLSRHIGGRDGDADTLADLLFRHIGGSEPPYWREVPANMADYLSEIPKGSLSPASPTDTAGTAGLLAEERESGRLASDKPKRTPKLGKKPTGPTVDHALLEQAESVVAAYAAASGRPMVNGTRAALLTSVSEHLEAGYPVEWLADRAREMAVRGWLDLAQHVARSQVPLPGQRQEPQQAQAAFRPEPILCDACRDDEGLLYTRDPLTGVERIVGRCSHGADAAAPAGTGAGR